VREACLSRDFYGWTDAAGSDEAAVAQVQLTWCHRHDSIAETSKRGSSTAQTAAIARERIARAL